MTKKTCWVLSNGIIGMDNQSFGLAEALGFDIVKKHIAPVAPWKYLPPQLCFGALKPALWPGSDRFEPPWPDVVIGTGRMTVAHSIAIKKASGGRTLNIRIQNPQVSKRHFDLVVAPQHDGCQGDNVVQTFGAVHRVTKAGLDAAAQQFSGQFKDLPRPLVAVMVGGSNKCYEMTPEVGRALAENLAAMSARTGAGIVLTCSRRTDPAVEQTIRAGLAKTPAYIWDGTGDNPYLAFLALADFIVVTPDSVNMVSEACYTGKPVYVVPMAGGSSKFLRFHEAMANAGYTRPFTGQLEAWHYTPLDDVGRVVAEIRKRLS
jgi:mitochondrial fission protein ELM1